MFEVQSDVPIPRGGRKEKYPWSDMKPDDSFFAPGACINSLTSCAHNQFGTGGYAIRSVTENGIHGVRVWRLK